MTKEKMILSTNLTNIISRSGKDQKEIAEAIGVSPAALNMWCNGVTYPRAPKIQALARYFHVPVSDLVDEHKTGTSYGLDFGNGFSVVFEEMDNGTTKRQLRILLEYVNKFNENGMDKMIERAQELEQLPQYKK